MPNRIQHGIKYLAFLETLLLSLESGVECDGFDEVVSSGGASDLNSDDGNGDEDDVSRVARAVMASVIRIAESLWSCWDASESGKGLSSSGSGTSGANGIATAAAIKDQYAAQFALMVSKVARCVLAAFATVSCGAPHCCLSFPPCCSDIPGR